MLNYVILYYKFVLHKPTVDIYILNEQFTADTVSKLLVSIQVHLSNTLQDVSFLRIWLSSNQN